MAAFRNWVTRCFENLIDPDKDAEVAELAELLHQGIVAQKHQFNLAAALKDRDYKDKHLELAKSNLYRKFLARAWQDGRVQPKERETLRWVARCLELSPKVHRALDVSFARAHFAEALAAAMDDEQIAAEESARLTDIAQGARLTLQQFTHEFFQSEGESFLRGLFAAIAEENRLEPDGFNHLIVTAARLGLSRSELLTAVRPQAARLVEHVLADAKEDEVLSPEEQSTIGYLLRTLELPDETRDYVLREVRDLQLISDARQGKLPSLPCPQGLSLKAGELVHYYGNATWVCVKQLKSGPTRMDHEGFLAITDSRLLFVATTRSQAFSLERVVAHQCSRGVIEMQVRNKPTERFICYQGPRIAYAILASAVAMANQTLVNQDGAARSRHIPRDVRQRIWQKYSGQCAECRASDYLEFDHIVPVAKGGSNSEANVQLLCRRCNLKKSDFI